MRQTGMAEVGRLIKRLRKAHDMSMRELGRLSGVSHATISLIERGKTEQPDASTLIALSAPLNVASQTLLETAGIEDKSQASSDLSPLTRQFVDVYERLPPDDQERLLIMAISLLQSEKSPEKAEA